MTEEQVEKVSLHVYDLSQGLAKQVSSALLGKDIEGIWHTGIAVYGTEYYFGGGILQTPVGTAPYGTPIKMIELGVTKIKQDAFESYLKEISPRYTHETYSLLKHNCNTFSNEVAQYLVGTTIPQYILDLPNDVINCPLAPVMMPMIQSLEAQLRDNQVPQVLQLVAPLPPSEGTKTAGDGSSEVKPTLIADPVVDPDGNARPQVYEEIVKEFAALRAQGNLTPSEAATLATKNVMQKHGFLNPTPPPST